MPGYSVTARRTPDHSCCWAQGATGYLVRRWPGNLGLQIGNSRCGPCILNTKTRSEEIQLQVGLFLGATAFPQHWLEHPCYAVRGEIMASYRGFGRAGILVSVGAVVLTCGCRQAREQPEAGSQAIGLDLARKQTPDLVVLDVMMPGLSGRDVTMALMQDPDTANIPILMLTAKTEDTG